MRKKLKQGELIDCFIAVYLYNERKRKRQLLASLGIFIFSKNQKFCLLF